MNQKKTFNVLDRIARDTIPDDINLLPRITARIESGKGTKMHPRLSLLTTLVLAALALILLTGVAYAVYHWMSDPGLQSLQDAGLEKNVGATGQPVISPSETPAPTLPPAAAIGDAQTLQGVTLTLDWVYLDEARLTFGFSIRDLPAGLELDVPSVAFMGYTPVQTRGASFIVRNTGEQTTGEYLSYQVIRGDEAGGKLDLDIRVRLVRLSGAQRSPLGEFHYSLKAVTVVAGATGATQQTYEAAVNSVALRLESVNVNQSITDVVLCNPNPVSGAIPSLQQVTLQVENSPAAAPGATTASDARPGEGCLRLEFPSASQAGAARLILSVQKLVTAPGQEFSGPWIFYVDLPDKQKVPGMASPTPAATPLGLQTLQGVTVTLDWVFADAKRISFGYSVAGLPAVPDATALWGSVDLRDAQGKPLGQAVGGSSAVQRVAGKPDTLTGNWSIVLGQPLTAAEGRFGLDITLGGGASSDMSNLLGQFKIPADATPFPPGVYPPALPAQKVGTFHFDFTTPIYPLQTLTPHLSITANGLAMSIEKIEMTPSYANLTLCYQKPSPKDWTIEGTVGRPQLSFGDYHATIYSYRLIFDKDMGGYLGKSASPTKIPGITTGRCVQIDFLLGNSYRPGTLTLTIPALEQSMPESIPPAELKAAQEKLKALGIEINQTTFSSSGGGGGGGPAIAKKPDGMTDEEAYRQYMQALGYVYPGPWVFTIDIK
jgi:hypothetical protein